MKAFVEDIENLTEDKWDLRRVLYTGGRLQLVLMALKRAEETGEDVHADHDQFFRIKKGKGDGLAIFSANRCNSLRRQS